MSAVAQAKRIVVKVGTSTLTYENGKLNLRRTEELCKVLSDLHNSGLEVVLVSSGAVGVGMGKLGIKERPTETCLLYTSWYDSVKILIGGWKDGTVSFS